MISRHSTLIVASIISDQFLHSVRINNYQGRLIKYEDRINDVKLREFLFEYNVKGFSIEKLCKSYEDKKYLKNNILNMHTGIFYNNEKYKQFESYGQDDVKSLIIGILDREISKERTEMLINSLKIDGYIYNDKKLYEINTDIDEKVSLIKLEFKNMSFDNFEEFDRFYNNMNKCFETSMWEDVIHNSRKLYEIVLMESAKKYSSLLQGSLIIKGTEKPVEIREYLEKNDFFSEDEANIIRYYYKYLSNIGSHPKMALKEQAEFSRVISINTILYIINRLEKYVNK